MGKVFVVQETLKRTSDGNWRRVHDFTPAAAYGEIEILIGGKQFIPIVIQPIIQELKSKLRDYSDKDFLLLAGDPVLMGIATAICSDVNRGVVNFLRWDRDTQRYIKVAGNLYKG